MSIGLVMEGGGLRGLFTAGVIDVLLEHHIVFDTAVGVSAGAIFGSNVKSEQIGRVLRFNLRFCQDRRYVSLHSLLTTGDIFGADFCYNQLTYHLDPFDYLAFAQNPMKFYAVCTHLKTGKPIYHLCQNGTPEDMIWIRASSSMPMVSRTVYIDDEPYLDGGIADPLPIEFIRNLGYNKIVVIRTRPKEYSATPLKSWLYPQIRYNTYPEFIHVWKQQHTIYNSSVDHLERLEQEGKAFIFQPPRATPANVIEKNPRNIQETYDMGRKVASERVEDLIQFIGSN